MKLSERSERSGGGARGESRGRSGAEKKETAPPERTAGDGKDPDA